jgi:outer membrane murein-binding lipoprotein Lpp
VIDLSTKLVEKGLQVE